MRMWILFNVCKCDLFSITLSECQFVFFSSCFVRSSAWNAWAYEEQVPEDVYLKRQNPNSKKFALKSPFSIILLSHKGIGSPAEEWGRRSPNNRLHFSCKTGQCINCLSPHPFHSQSVMIPSIVSQLLGLFSSIEQKKRERERLLKVSALFPECETRDDPKKLCDTITQNAPTRHPTRTLSLLLLLLWHLHHLRKMAQCVSPVWQFLVSQSVRSHCC